MKKEIIHFFVRMNKAEAFLAFKELHDSKIDELAIFLLNHLSDLCFIPDELVDREDFLALVNLLKLSPDRLFTLIVNEEALALAVLGFRHVVFNELDFDFLHGASSNIERTLMKLYHESMKIKRYPLQTDDTLQGWDSADELLLTHVRSLELSGKKILILNDSFGALSVGLMDFDFMTYTDSFVSAKAIALNSLGKVTAINDLADIHGIFDLVLIRIPKSLSFFEDQLCHLTQHLHPESKIVCASMVKHLSPGSFDLLNKHIGTTTTSLAEKKARLVFASFQKEKVKSTYPQSIKVDGFEKPFLNHSNLFSREKLDIGTRFFLEHIPRGPYPLILDLGCANGIIGIQAKLKNPQARIIFSDESWMAIKSAKYNYQNHFQDEADFFWTNCFEDRSVKNIDLVLCNPPFHQQNTVGDFIAWEMFKDSREVLRNGGTLVVIGNSHLGYQVKMKKLLGNSRIIATNQKFMVCESQK